MTLQLLTILELPNSYSRHCGNRSRNPRCDLASTVPGCLRATRTTQISARAVIRRARRTLPALIVAHGRVNASDGASGGRKAIEEQSMLPSYGAFGRVLRKIFRGADVTDAAMDMAGACWGCVRCRVL